MPVPLRRARADRSRHARWPAQSGLGGPEYARGPGPGRLVLCSQRSAVWAASETTASEPKAAEREGGRLTHIAMWIVEKPGEGAQVVMGVGGR